MSACAGLAAVCLTAACLVAAAACGPARPPVVEIAQAPAATADGTAEEPAAEALAAGAGCQWTGTALYGRDGADMTLCFASDAACFARAHSGLSERVTLTFPEGDPQKTGVWLDLLGDGVRIRAWTSGEGPLLFPSRPVVLGGVAIPTEGDAVRIERVSSGRRADMVLVPDSDAHALRGPLRGHAPCKDLQIERRWLTLETVRPAIGVATAALGERELLPGPVGFGPTVSGPAVLEVLAPKPASHEEAPVVALLEQQGARSRILWERDRAVLFGWVDTSVLGPAPTKARRQELSATGSLSPTPAPGIRCPEAIPLFAEVSGAREEVGTIEKQTLFDVVESSAETATIELRSRYLALTPGSKWTISAAAIRGCKAE